MGQFVRPKVYLIGYPMVDMEGVTSYLTDTGQADFLQTLHEAMTQGLSMGEVLCSFYAKLCYKSLVLGKNTNVSRVRDIQGNLESCHDTGHGCYDGETDVLTESGWKPWPEITSSDKLATLDARTGELVYRKPVEVQRFRTSGRMYRVESDHVDLLVTHNHKMYACVTTTKEGRKKGDESYGLIEAQKLGSSSHAYIKTAEWKPADPVCTQDDAIGLLQPAELKLLGFSIGDGYYPGSGNVVRFRLRRHRKIKYLRDLAAKLNYALREDGDRFNLTVDASIAPLFAEMYTEDGDKQIPQRILLSHPAEYLNDLLDGLLESDGHRSETGDSFDTTSPRLVDQFQQLCLHAGVAANVVYTYEGEDRATSLGDKPLTRLSVIRRSTRPEVNKWAGQSGKTSWVEDWSGYVYCAQMGEGTKHVLYVRRNGKPVWCGNSVFEHANINFVVTNCSRVYTHEQVRHRVGVAYSQTSGRYCRLDEIDIVLDPILEPAKGVVSECLSQIERAVYLAECKLGLRRPPNNGLPHPDHSITPEMWYNDNGTYEIPEYKWVPDDSLDFTTRKKITSAIRRIAPNGQSNEMGMTINIRALRHLVQLRTQRFAEWEIRDIYNQIYRLTKSRFPTLYHGAKERVVDGLLEVYGMRTQPYEEKG